MSAKTEKKLENLENDVVNMEEKFKEFQEKLRRKKEKTEETRNLAIVEIVRERSVSISQLKAALDNGGKLLDNPANTSAGITPISISKAIAKETAKNFNNEREETELEEIN